MLFLPFVYVCAGGGAELLFARSISIDSWAGASNVVIFPLVACEFE